MTTRLPSLTLPRVVFEQPAVSILVPLALGNAIGFLTRPRETKNTYNALKQPPGSPPAYVFAPVWSALYGAMGYAAYRAWTTGSSSIDPVVQQFAQQGAVLYTMQLGLNLAWMPLFFGLGRPIEATVDIVSLVSVTGYLTYVWSKIDDVAAWCMVPYLGWLGFATYLCVSATTLLEDEKLMTTRLAPVI